MADLLKRLQTSEQQYGVGMEDNPFHNASPDECMHTCFGGSGGGSPPPPPPSTVTQQTSNIPEYFQPYLERLFERAEAVTTEPFQRYEGQRLATTTPQQQAAYQGVEEMVGGYKPYIATADLLTAQAAQQSTDPAAIASRMSPYQQSVIDIQKREALRDANKLQQQIGASAVGAGAFGGSRQALQESELGRQTGQRLADIQAVGSQQAYQQAMNQLAADRAASLAAGQQFAGLGAQQQQLGLAGLGALETVGGTQQAQQQRALDIGYEDFARETTRPSQQVQEMSSVLRGFNLPVSTYTTSQAQQAPPTFGQQAAGLGLGALGIYGAGKGVGLFAEGGDVPDNPGLKKLASKAPQVVEKMGFDPQEVMNAYVGGRMNYEEGGDTGSSISNFLERYGTPASIATGAAPFLYMGARKFTAPARFIANEIKRIKSMKGLTESEKKMRLEKMIRDNREAIGADKKLGDMMVFGKPLREIGRDIVSKGKDIAGSFRGRDTQRAIDEAVEAGAKPTSQQTINLPVPKATKPGVFAQRGTGGQQQINQLPAVAPGRPTSMGTTQAIARTDPSIASSLQLMDATDTTKATMEQKDTTDNKEPVIDPNKIITEKEESSLDMLRNMLNPKEEGIDIMGAKTGLLDLIAAEDIRTGRAGAEEAAKRITERGLAQQKLKSDEQQNQFNNAVAIAGLDLKQQELVANEAASIRKYISDTLKLDADRTNKYMAEILGNPMLVDLLQDPETKTKIIRQILDTEQGLKKGIGAEKDSTDKANLGTTDSGVTFKIKGIPNLLNKD